MILRGCRIDLETIHVLGDAEDLWAIAHVGCKIDIEPLHLLGDAKDVWTRAHVGGAIVCAVIHHGRGVDGSC